MKLLGEMRSKGLRPDQNSYRFAMKVTCRATAVVCWCCRRRWWWWWEGGMVVVGEVVVVVVVVVSQHLSKFNLAGRKPV